MDLCCGVGGWSEGLRQAGVPVTLAVDVWPLALQSHTANHPDAEHVEADVRTLVGSVGRADVVVGGPPCQEFSPIGRVRGKGADTSVIDACLAIVEEARPRWWVFENVPRAARVFEARGVPVRFLKASAFGLEHRRKRAFAGRFAPPLATGIARERFHTPLASEGKMGRNSARFQRGKAFHQILGRRPKPEDMKRAMGFPESYVAFGSIENQCRLFGNAVCPPVARAIVAAQVPEVVA